VIIDLRRVAALTRAAARLLVEGFRELAKFNVTLVISGAERSSPTWQTLTERAGDLSNLRHYFLLDEAIEWTEDQIIYRHGGDIESAEAAELSGQALLQGLTGEEIAALAKIGIHRSYQAGRRIISVGDHDSSLLFLTRGTVKVQRGSARLATLTAGMVVGEMALLDLTRSADVIAESAVTCVEISIADFNRFRIAHPRISERIMRNLALLLAERLVVANNRISLLAAN
jgi:glutaminase